MSTNEIMTIIDQNTPNAIAGFINRGELTLTELNDALVESVKGVTDNDKSEIALFLKREKKVDDCISYLDY